MPEPAEMPENDAAAFQPNSNFKMINSSGTPMKQLPYSSWPFESMFNTLACRENSI